MSKENRPMAEEREKDTEPSPGSTPQTGDIATLEEKIAQKDAEIASLVDRLKRLQAEFENYKKRIARDAVALEEQTVNQVILDFLPLFDNFERAFANFTGHDEDVHAFTEGMERIFAQFDQLLKQKGIVKIDAAGRRFDPARHEALLSVPSTKEKDLILEEFEPGYIRNERVLRPSKVKVSQGKIEAKEEKTE